MADVTDIASSPRARFGAAMDELEIAYNLKIATLRRDVYWKYLKRVPIDDLVGAVALIVESYTSFPKIPQWRKMAERFRKLAVQPTHTGDGVPINRQLPAPPPGQIVFCHACRDTGWAETTVVKHEMTYSAVRACECRINKTNPLVVAKWNLNAKKQKAHFQDEGAEETHEHRRAEKADLFD